MPRDTVLTRPFVLAMAAHFFHCIAFNLYLHLPGFLKSLGADEARIGLIFGVTAATAIAIRPVMGRAMDARGRRPVILVGGAFHVIACALYLAVRVLGVRVWGVRLLHGLAEASLFAALFAIAADLVPEKRRIEGIALFGVSGMLPISLGGLLGDFILAHGDYRTLFATSVAFALGGFLLSLSLRDVSAEHSEPSRGFLAPALQSDLLPIWLLGFAFSFALAAHFTFLKTFVLLTGVGSVGTFFTLYSLSAITLRIFFGTLPDRLGPRRVLLPALLLLTCGQILLSRAHTSSTVSMAGVLCGLGHGFTFPILCGLVVSRARPSERGAALALFTALFDGGTLFGAPVLGLVIRSSGYPVMFALAASVVMVATLSFFAWDRARTVR